MILGSLQDLEQDRLVLAPALVRGLDYLKNTDFTKVENGRYEIDGSNLVAIVQEYQTSPKELCEAETHCKYIDIQYMVDGIEKIGIALLTPDCEVLRNSSAENDAIIYQSVANESEFILGSGMYAIFFPTDIHRPCCQFNSESKVKKVVLKVAVSIVKQ